MTPDLSKIDWIALVEGKSHLQAWAIGDGQPIGHMLGKRVATQSRTLSEADILGLIGGWLGPHPVPVLISGRTTARDEPVPAAPGVLQPEPLATLDPRLRAYALPGLTQASPPGVMHSDATCIAGFLALNSTWDGVICLPGAQTNWALVSAGEVVGFQTYVTGDLAMLLANSLSLPASPDQQGWDSEMFASALDETLARPERLALSLGALRLVDPAQAQPRAVAQAQLWGALIGAELAAARPYWLGQQLAVIGPADIAELYRVALERQGAPATIADADRMVLAGLTVARQQMG